MSKPVFPRASKLVRQHGETISKNKRVLCFFRQNPRD
jgi:hypothetical protein